MNLSLSVIICTHNPRVNYLRRVLKSLKEQTLPIEYWELLLIDNASSKILSSEIDLSWHSHAHHVREEKVGLTPARLCGIREAQAEILVFVDDDNLLDRAYLEAALQISKDWSMLGAWGGETIPEFEEPAPEWSRPYWELIGIRELDRDRWGNSMAWENTPIGAGLCIRKIVAEKYAKITTEDPQRLMLDRSGKLLSGSGDLDMAYTSLDMGLGIGRFKALKLIHLIPSFRLQESYFQKLITGTTYSQTILLHLRGVQVLEKEWLIRLKLAIPLPINPKFLFIEPRKRKFGFAAKKGHLIASQEILKQKH